MGSRNDPYGVKDYRMKTKATGAMPYGTIPKMNDERLKGKMYSETGA